MFNQTYLKEKILCVFGLVCKMIANGLEDRSSIPDSHTEDSKIVVDATLFNIQHYKVQIKGEGEQSRERSCVFQNISV